MTREEMKEGVEALHYVMSAQSYLAQMYFPSYGSGDPAEWLSDAWMELRLAEMRIRRELRAAL